MSGDSTKRGSILFWVTIAGFLGLLWQIWRGEHPQPQDPVTVPLPVRVVGDETKQREFEVNGLPERRSPPIVEPTHHPETMIAEKTFDKGLSGPAPVLPNPAESNGSPSPAAPLRTEMKVGDNALGLTASVSRPVIQANKWTFMKVTVTLRAASNGLIALPADIYYNMPGWTAEVGGSGAPCTSNNDRVGWPSGRGKAITMSAGDEIALPIEFTCGHGGDFLPGGAVTIHLQLIADVGSGTRPISIFANDIAYTKR